MYERHYGNSYKEMINRKRRLFKAADLDEDKKLTKDELGDFLHPGQSDGRTLQLLFGYNNILVILYRGSATHEADVR